MPPGADAGDGTTRAGIELRTPTAILDDERAIEGLPIRLVIALVIGVAALSVMMTMIEDTSELGTSEMDVEPDPETIDLGTDGTRDVTLQVVDEDGDTVADATVILAGGSARLPDGPYHAETDGDGEATFEDVSPSLEANQQQGTLEVDIQPPGNTDLEDRRENTEILVLHS